MGAVAVHLHRRRDRDAPQGPPAPPIGSISQMAHIRLGKRTENRNPKIKEFVPLAGLDDIVFGGWDPIFERARGRLQRRRARRARPRPDLKATSRRSCRWKAVFDQRYVKKLDGSGSRDRNKWDQAGS
jgi:myo-inositol-1-phosphate synthase